MKYKQGQMNGGRGLGAVTLHPIDEMGNRCFEAHISDVDKFETKKINFINTRSLILSFSSRKQKNK